MGERLERVKRCITSSGDRLLYGEMNTLRMGEFLGQVSRAHPDDFMVLIVDGTSSHLTKDLAVPENIRLLPLPAYAPELNPQEHVWIELREKEFPNRGCSTTSMP